MLAPIEEIFCEIDDFCNQILKEEERHLLADPNRQRQRRLRLGRSGGAERCASFFFGEPSLEKFASQINKMLD